MKNIIIIFLTLCLCGCGKFLDDYSQDLVVAKTVTDLDEVLLGSVYIPSNNVSDLYKGSIGWWLHILDDDINTVITRIANRGTFDMNFWYYGYTTWQMEVGRYYDGTKLNNDNALWDGLYQRINVANIILSEIDDMHREVPSDEEAALRIKGEAHFIRAQFYLMLINLYADMYEPSKAATTLGVPLKLTEYVEHDKDKGSQFERTSVEIVYRQIVDDLQTSINFFEESGQKRGFYRASKEAAYLLLSRVYLYMQEWSLAKESAEKFLSLKKSLLDYSFIANEGVAISSGSPEIIFTQGSLNAQNFFTGVGGDFCISNDLYSIYEDDDYRKEIFFDRSVVSDSITLARKHSMGIHKSYVSDIFLLRTSEGYLNAAEACAMLDDAVGAMNWLNQFRHQRIASYSNKNYSGNELIEQIRNERRKELCIEGHRWFDLRRYSVNQKAPFKKEIVRTFAKYNYDSRNQYMGAEFYRLEKDDKAYTFAIPKSVLEFDTDIPDNIRDQRSYFDLINAEEE